MSREYPSREEWQQMDWESRPDRFINSSHNGLNGPQHLLRIQERRVMQWRQ